MVRRSARVCCVLVLSTVAAAYLFLLITLFKYTGQGTVGGGGRGGGHARGKPSAFREREASGCVNIYFSKNKPAVALASFPGSGNTWVRHLLQQASGVYTGSIYFDRSLVKEGFKGEGIANGSVIVIKTHEWDSTSFNKYDKAILIVRNPFEAILAEFNRHFAGHRGHATKSKFMMGSIWPDFVEGKSQSWTDTVMSWVKFPRPLLIIKYEKLVENPREELSRLLKFLDIKINGPHMNCVLENSEGYFHRKKKPLEFDPFTAEMRSKISIFQGAVNIVIDTYNQYMCKQWPNLCL